ncbi:MAG: immunoglobulin-like domain-containing protein [Patescibacteria group bacterium]
MRLLALHAVSLSVLLLGVPLAAYADTAFTSNGVAPYVSGIAVKVNGDFVPPSTKTQHNVTVVISVESFGKSYTIDTPLNSDSYTFTENGDFEFTFHDEDVATGRSTVKVENIDRTTPVSTIDSYSASPTNAPVTVSAATNEGALSASSHTFTENGSFDFVAVDEAGNSATSTVTVSNIDTEAPVISRAGEASVEVRAGNEYTDAGASVSDNTDTNVAVVMDGSVDTNTVGIYTLTYTATDAAGNSATPVTRTVEVYRKSSGGSARISTPDSQPLAGRVLGASTYNFSADLTVGATGDDVTALQNLLREQGYFTEEPTGYFGPKTKAAVVAFQASSGLPQTGYVGPLTRSALGGSPTQAISVEAQIALLTAQLKALQAQYALLQQ